MVAPIARIALAIPVRRLFDYRIPDELSEQLQPGMRVRVPFSGRSRTGYCIERAEESEFEKVLDIAEVLDESPILDDELLQLCQWTADYYLTSVGEVIEAALPKGVRQPRSRTITWVTLTPGEHEPERGSGKGVRERIREILADHSDGLPLEQLLERAGASKAPVKSLESKGRVALTQRPRPFGFGAVATAKTTPLPLNSHQRVAVDEIAKAALEPRFQCFLLQGVTGSGKTEVYLQCLDQVLAAHRSALVLLPEIALTAQTVARFEQRLGPVAVLHSMLPDAERAAMHQRLANGDTRIAIGARSAVFAPIPDLGLIVVDESHESSYKQDRTPRYHGRDLAVLRAARLGIPCVLGTATPSLESLENARQGRYQRLLLPERATSQPLATIEIVDRRTEPKGGGLISPRLCALLKSTIERSEQAILFLNRRGFARNINCQQCGYALRCNSCDIGLTYHKQNHRSLCHYCGTVRAVPTSCPDCSFTGLRQSRPGTERIEEILAQICPTARIGRLDRDTATTKQRLEEILDEFRNGRTDILVGTQMVAKGHDIPGVTLVGIIDADLALGLPDFRAAERTAQLICQVAGRAGRGDRPGRVIVQTHQPEHYAIESGRRQDLEYLYDKEASTRRLLGYPPFGYLVRIVCEDRDEGRALASAKETGESLASNCQEGVRILGPAPAPLARLRSWYRFHILVKGPSRPALRKTIDLACASPLRHSTTRRVIDVDPQSLL